MKTARFVFIAGLLITVVFALLVFIRTGQEQTGQNSKTKRDVFVTEVPDDNHTDDVSIMLTEHLGNDSSETLSNHPDTPPTEIAVVYASPESQTGKNLPQELPVAKDKPDLSVGQKTNGLFVSEHEPDLSVGQKRLLVVPDEAIDKTESDRIGIDGLYAGNPEVHGQNGEELPSPETVLAHKAQSILHYYNDRKAEAIIISEEVDGDDHSESADTEVLAEVVTSVEGTVETLAKQNTSDNTTDAKSQTDQLLAALAEGNPIDVRLEAIYLLADVAPEQVKKFLNDKEEIIRYEAERIIGVLPED